MNQPTIDFGDSPLPTPPAQTVGHGSSAAVPSSLFSTFKSALLELNKEQTEELMEEIKKEVASIPDQDPMDAANRLRQTAARELEEMEWDGARLRMTSFVYSTYEYLRLVRTNGEQQTQEQIFLSRYLDAGLLIHLCMNGAVPSRAPSERLKDVRDWLGFEVFPAGRQDELLSKANRILDLTDLFVPVPRQSKEEKDEDAEPEKKTPLQDGSHVISPSSANP